MIKRTLYVNVYREERCYGGPEEGGGWYSSYTPVEFEAVECNCNLPLNEYPVQDDNGDYTGWHVELDTWVGHHEDTCDSKSLFDRFDNKWKGFEDTWYPQDPNDESEPRTGESFSSGKIWIGVESAKASYKPELRPMYS